MIRQAIYEPSNGKDGYQVESWIEKQVSKGAVLRTRDGRPIRLTDKRLQAYLEHGVEGGSFITGTSSELIYANVASGTAKASFTTEIAINDTAGMGNLAHIPVDFWTPSNSPGKTIRIVARGIQSSTVTPTYQFNTRLGAAANITTALVLGTAALATKSTAANASWECRGEVTMTIVGAAGANSTVRGLGMHLAGSDSFTTNAGINFYNAGGSATAPTNAQIDVSIVNVVNFNIVCSANSASNSIQLLQLLVFGLN